jgi:hypothetical protein
MTYLLWALGNTKIKLAQNLKQPRNVFTRYLKPTTPHLPTACYRTQTHHGDAAAIVIDICGNPNTVVHAIPAQKARPHGVAEQEI